MRRELREEFYETPLRVAVAQPVEKWRCCTAETPCKRTDSGKALRCAQDRMVGSDSIGPLRSPGEILLISSSVSHALSNCVESNNECARLFLRLLKKGKPFLIIISFLSVVLRTPLSKTGPACRDAVTDCWHLKASVLSSCSGPLSFQLKGGIGQ